MVCGSPATATVTSVCTTAFGQSCIVQLDGLIQFVFSPNVPFDISNEIIITFDNRDFSGTISATKDTNYFDTGSTVTTSTTVASFIGPMKPKSTSTEQITLYLQSSQILDSVRNSFPMSIVFQTIAGYKIS